MTIYIHFRFDTLDTRGIVSLRHGASRRGRCLAMRYVIHGPNRSTSLVHVASLIESFIGHLIRSISLLMPAIRSIESHRVHRSFFFHILARERYDRIIRTLFLASFPFLALSKLTFELTFETRILILLA